MEYGIPREHAAEAVRRVLQLAARPEHRVAYPIEVRFAAADDVILSAAHARDVCYIAVHQDRKLDWEPYFRGVEEIMDSYGGRPHWGKRHFQAAETLAPRYPRWDEFQRAARAARPRAPVRQRLHRAGPRFVARCAGPIGSRLVETASRSMSLEQADEAALWRGAAAEHARRAAPGRRRRSTRCTVSEGRAPAAPESRSPPRASVDRAAVVARPAG